VNRDLTQNLPTCSITPIHADEITMNANARNQRRRFDSYPLRHFERGGRNSEREIQTPAETGPVSFSSIPHSAFRISCRREVVAMSREQILKLTSLSSCAG